ncbi:MAG: SPASM domain-containing protein [Candidatus Aureabacteria bacterium]|nr:SPASM domain-containing protein [Candidatus Auribacterota bacterium]
MKASYFNFFINDHPEKGQVLILNTRTQAIAVFEKELADILQNNSGKVIDLDENKFSELLEEGFCIKDDICEKDILESWFHEICYKQKNITATILTTYNCNFACPYCFEGSATNKPENMTKKTMNNICKWLFTKAIDINAKSINIFFYGGEPLLNKEIIDNISPRIYSFCKHKGITFKFGIVTNGYLIKKQDSDYWKTYGLDFYRITLDGSKTWHNKTRPLKGNMPTFQTIVNNIRSNTSGVKVLISGNYTKETSTGFYELIEYLSKSDIKEKIHSLSFTPVIKTLASSCRSEHGLCEVNNDVELNQIYLDIKKFYKKHGFKDSRKNISMQTCPFKINDTNITMTPDGCIYKCPATIGHKEFSVGNVKEIHLNDKNKEIITSDLWKECYPCVYLPICSGGCYYSSYVKEGHFPAIDCQKTFIEKSLTNDLKEEYASSI